MRLGTGWGQGQGPGDHTSTATSRVLWKRLVPRCTGSHAQPTSEACSLPPVKPPVKKGQPCRHRAWEGAKAIQGTNDKEPVTRPAEVQGTPCSPCLRSTSCTAGWTGWSPGGSPDTGCKTWGETWAKGGAHVHITDMRADHIHVQTRSSEHINMHTPHTQRTQITHPPAKPCHGPSTWGTTLYQRAAGSPDSLAPDPYDVVVHQAQEDIKQAAAGLVQGAALEKQVEVHVGEQDTLARDTQGGEGVGGSGQAGTAWVIVALAGLRPRATGPDDLCHTLTLWHVVGSCGTWWGPRKGIHPEGSEPYLEDRLNRKRFCRKPQTQEQSLCRQRKPGFPT